MWADTGKLGHFFGSILFVGWMDEWTLVRDFLDEAKRWQHYEPIRDHFVKQSTSLNHETAIKPKRVASFYLSPLSRPF